MSNLGEKEKNSKGAPTLETDNAPLTPFTVYGSLYFKGILKHYLEVREVDVLIIFCCQLKLGQQRAPTNVLVY